MPALSAKALPSSVLVRGASVFTLETEFVLYHVPSTLDMDLTMYGLINEFPAPRSLFPTAFMPRGWGEKNRHKDADSTGKGQWPSIDRGI